MGLLGMTVPLKAPGFALQAGDPGGWGGGHFSTRRTMTRLFFQAFGTKILPEFAPFETVFSTKA